MSPLHKAVLHGHGLLPHDDVLQKRYNIAIACSLGNRWFTPENVLPIIVWNLDHTKEFVCIYVADTIHSINISVREGISRQKATTKAIKQGADLLAKIRESIKQLPVEQQGKILFGTWGDIEQDSKNRKALAYLYKKYNEDEAFAKAFQDLVRDFTKKESRTFTDEQIRELSFYLLEELPELMNSVSFHGQTFKAVSYPFDGPVMTFFDDLFNGRQFPEVREHIIWDPKIFLFVR